MLFKKKIIEVASPVDGKLIPITDVKDEVFSKKMLGDGFAVDPTSGSFYAPLDGELVTVFPHAFGIKHKSGIQVLLHIGLDTVTLKGQHFTLHCGVGQKVKTGDLLVEVELDKVKKKVPSMHTPLVFMPDTVDDKTITYEPFNKKVGHGAIVARIQ